MNRCLAAVFCLERRRIRTAALRFYTVCFRRFISVLVSSNPLWEIWLAALALLFQFPRVSRYAAGANYSSRAFLDNNHAEMPEIVAVNSCICISGFKDFHSYSVNDVALLQLSIPFIVTDYVRPICLPRRRPSVSPGGKSSCYVAGWGTKCKWISS